MPRAYSNSYLETRDELLEMARLKEAAGLTEPEEARERLSHRAKKERKNHILQMCYLTEKWK